jgi:D-galacturonate reductase
MAPVNVLMMGTGEYTTGWVGKKSDSDKSTGVVGLVMLDLKRRGKVGRLGMCGTNGTKLPAIRDHMAALGEAYEGIDPSTIETFPADDVVDREAYKGAVASFAPGDVAIVFTPDDTHFAIALACIKRGVHVMITKPPVKTLAEHNALAAAARDAGVLCVVEVHKRFDPIYRDARDRIASLGNFSFFQAYMSQPKHQLETFRAWAGKSSDISYYLNSHHVDFHEWAVHGRARPERVTALASTGVAEASLGRPCEDTITLSVQWRNLADGALGHALYTSSWVAPKSDVHSQQRWFYMGASGEISVDQAHRGYTVATDASGYGSVNPLFWKPTPSNGKFVGQACYGYVSFESFVDAAAALNAKATTLAACDADLPTMATTAGATAILEAGRKSLDAGGAPFDLVYADGASTTPVDMKPAF